MTEQSYDQEKENEPNKTGKMIKVIGVIAFLFLILLTPLGIYVNMAMSHLENGLMYVIGLMGFLIIPFSLMLIFVIIRRKMNKALLIIPIVLLIVSNALFIFLAKTKLLLNDIIKKSGTIVPEVKDYYLFEGEIPANLDFDIETVKALKEFDSRVKWPGCITDVHNQYSCGTCWSYATTSVIGDLVNIKKWNNSDKPLPETDKVILSPQYLVECWQGYEGEKKCASGETISRALTYGKEIGSMSLKCKPVKMDAWNSNTDMCNSLPCFDKCGANCTNGDGNGEVYKLKNIKKLSKRDSLANNILRIKNSLMKNGPVVAGMSVYDNIPRGIHSGIYKGPEENSRNIGGHAISIVGWGSNETVGEYWIVRNSWGKVWGLLSDLGYFHLKMGECAIEQNTYEGLY